MAVEESYRQLVQSAIQATPLSIVLGASDAADDRIERVTLTGELQQEFQAVIQKVTDDEVLSFVPYDPLYKLESGELAWIDLDEYPELKAKVERVSDVGRLALFREEEEMMRSLRFHVTVKSSRDQGSQLFFRQMSPSRQLKRSRYFGAFLASGAFNAVEETMFLFDSMIDCMSDGQYMFIRNVKNFERIFSFLAKLQASAESVVDVVLQQIPVENEAEFRKACTSQVRFMTKLAGISKRLYLQNLSMESICDLIADHNLDVEVKEVDGQRRLVFDSALSRRWMLLKLLDDDYLASSLTELKYEVNSKQSRS